MRRVMIIGQPGSGKSTFARAMGELTFLPVHHIDRIHWKPGWIERSRAEKTRLCEEVHSQDAWIFEGGHSATWPA
ncbi:MAG: AAA family ATPase, partial [Jannaschia sp.]